MVVVLGIENAALLHRIAASSIVDWTVLGQLLVFIQVVPPSICRA